MEYCVYVCACTHERESACAVTAYFDKPVLIGRIRHALVLLVTFARFLSLVSYRISLLCVIFSSGSVSRPIDKRIGYLPYTVVFLRMCVGYELLR